MQQAREDAREGHEDQVGAAQVCEQRGGGRDEAPGRGRQQDDLLTPDPGGQEGGDGGARQLGHAAGPATLLWGHPPGWGVWAIPPRSSPGWRLSVRAQGAIRPSIPTPPERSPGRRAPPPSQDPGSPSSASSGGTVPTGISQEATPRALQPSTGSGWRVPVPQVAASDLGQAVAPEEAAEHDPGFLLVPAEVLAHGDGADGHADTGTVEQACAQQQRPRPHLALRPAGQGAPVRPGQAGSEGGTGPPPKHLGVPR